MALGRTSSLLILVLGLIVLVAGVACIFFTDIKDLYLYIVAILGVIIALGGGYLYYQSR